MDLLRSEGSNLLRLPVELRHQIYHHLFSEAWLTFETHPKAIDIFQKDHPFWILQPPESQVLLTCKQIYTEALPFVHIPNCLRFRGLDGIMLMKRYSTVARRNQIRHVQGVSVGANYRYGKWLSNFAKLESVHITCFRACYAGAEDVFAKANYEDDLIVLTSSGVDTIGPGALFERQKQFGWKSLRIDAYCYFDVAARPPDNPGRAAIPCSFDLLARTVTKDWSRRVLVRYEPGGTPIYPNPYSMPSALAEREYHQYAQDQTILQQRYAKFLDCDRGKEPKHSAKRKRELRSKSRA